MKLVEITKEWFQETSLDAFTRRNQVTEVYRRQEDGSFRTVPASFTDDWDEAKKRKVAQRLLDEQTVSFAILDSETNDITAFVSMDRNLRDGRMTVEHLHVDKDYRRQGMGAMLLGIAKAAAKQNGGSGLFVPVDSDAETVAFFRAMGGRIAEKMPEDIAAKDPFGLPFVLGL